MLRRITYNSVNWEDGMKITKDHFIQLENNLLDYIRDANAIRINSFNYGILPAHADANGESLKYNMIIDRNGLLKIDILECRAITPAGTRIEISAGNSYSDQKRLSKEVNLTEIGTTSFYVVVSSNPFERQPVGEPDPAESPPRFPFAIPSYSIDIVPVENFNKSTSGPFHVAIAKIKYTNTRTFVQDENYIPPSCTIQCSPDLIEIHAGLDKFLCKIEEYAVEIVKKIYKKQQTSEVAVAVLYLCERVMDFLSTRISHFRWVLAEQPPIYIVEFYMQFARLVKNSIDVKEGTGKEQMLTYFKDWIIEVKQGEFEAVVESLIAAKYNHEDVNQNVEDIYNFAQTLKTVFEKLSKLDYIGDKKKGMDLTVKSVDANTKQNLVPKKRSPFIVDE